MYCGTHFKAQEKSLSVLEILTLETEDALSGVAYKNILKEKFPEAKLKEILLVIPLLFHRAEVQGSIHFHQAIGTLYEYSKKNKLSNKFVPILIDALDRHMMMESTLENVKMLEKLTNIKVGWDKNYVKNWKGSKAEYEDRKLKIAQWEKWVDDNKIINLVTNRLLPKTNSIEVLENIDFSKLEKLDDIVKIFSCLAYDEDAENKIFNLIDTINKYDSFKRDIFRFYAIEALKIYSEGHEISGKRIPVLINCLKECQSLDFKISINNAELIKKITKLDVGWEKNFYQFASESLNKEDPRGKMIEQWENWVKQSNSK